MRGCPGRHRPPFFDGGTTDACQQLLGLFGADQMKSVVGSCLRLGQMDFATLCISGNRSGSLRQEYGAADDLLAWAQKIRIWQIRYSSGRPSPRPIGNEVMDGGAIPRQIPVPPLMQPWGVRVDRILSIDDAIVWAQEELGRSVSKGRIMNLLLDERISVHFRRKSTCMGWQSISERQT